MRSCWIITSSAKGGRMADIGSILVTGAAGELGAVGRTVTELLLDRGIPVRARVRREDERAAALRAAGAELMIGDRFDRPTSIGLSAAVGGSTSACWCPPGTVTRPRPWRRAPAGGGGDAPGNMPPVTDPPTGAPTPPPGPH